MLSLLAREGESASLDVGLGGVQVESRVFHCLAGTCGEHDVGVECSTPASEELALDLGILCQPSLSDLFAGNGKLLERSGERVLASTGVLSLQSVRAVHCGAGNSVAEGLGLRLCGRGCGKSSLCFGGGGCGGEELDLLADGAAKVVEGLADVGRVVVSFVRVLRTVKAGLSEKP